MHSVLKILTGVGNQSFVANGVYTYQLTTLRNVVSFGNLHAYLRRLVIELDLSITNSTGGQITIGWRHLYDVLQGLKLTLKTFDKPLYELVNQAGVSMFVENFLKTRRNPDYATNLVIANAATGTVNLKIPVNFFDLRMREPEDQIVYTPLLDGSELQLQWSAGTIFGANTTITTATMFSRLTAELVARNEIRTPTLVRCREQNPVAVGNTELDMQGHFPLDVVLEPIHAAGVSETTFAAANLTAINLTADGVKVHDAINPNVIPPMFNDDTYDSADMLTQWEAGGALMVPIVFLQRFNGKKSKVFYVKGKPLLEMTGTLSTANYRILERMIVPVGEETARAALAKIGIEAGAGELSPKSHSKVPILDQSTVLTTPWKFKPRPKGAPAKAV